MTYTNFIRHLKFLKPNIFWRVIKDYSLTALGFNRLRTLDCAITYRCNSDCQMCSAKYLKSNKEELSADEIIRVWNEARELGVIHINLTGGEPTLKPYDELAKIVHEISKTGAIVSMVTNSIALNLNQLVYLTGLGLDVIQLSLESMNPDTHDRIRRSPGNFTKVMEVFEWAKKLKLNIVLSTVITASNFGEIERIISFAEKEKVFVLLSPISASGANEGDYSQSIARKKKEYYSLLKKGNVRSDITINFRGGSGCPAGVERIYMTPYGDIMTCPHVQISFGNIRNESLKKIYHRISNFPLLRNYERDCRHVFNQDYIERMIKPTYGKKLPVPIDEHPIMKILQSFPKVE